jgi:hypothetical protein
MSSNPPTRCHTSLAAPKRAVSQPERSNNLHIMYTIIPNQLLRSIIIYTRTIHTPPHSPAGSERCGASPPVSTLFGRCSALVHIFIFAAEVPSVRLKRTRVCEYLGAGVQGKAQKGAWGACRALVQCRLPGLSPCPGVSDTASTQGLQAAPPLLLRDVL